MPSGQIVSLAAQKGFGFIRPDEGGPDLFFHHSTINKSLHELAEGQPVEYYLDAEAKKPRASNVMIKGEQLKPSPRSESGGDRRGGDRRGGDRRGGGERRPSRDGQKFSRGPRTDRQSGFDRGSRSESSTSYSSGFKLERGYVTKLLWKTRQGFISSDKGGDEFLFCEADVGGNKPYRKLEIGDYVQFSRTGKVERTKIDKAPTANRVEVIEKEVKLPEMKELPNNTRSRRKKPTWRR